MQTKTLKLADIFGLLKQFFEKNSKKSTHCKKPLTGANTLTSPLFKNDQKMLLMGVK